MSKDRRSKKKAKDADRWLSANAPKTADTPCTRCGRLINAADLGQHFHDAHLGGGR